MHTRPHTHTPTPSHNSLGDRAKGQGARVPGQVGRGHGYHGAFNLQPATESGRAIPGLLAYCGPPASCLHAPCHAPARSILPDCIHLLHRHTAPAVRNSASTLTSLARLCHCVVSASTHASSLVVDTRPFGHALQQGGSPGAGLMVSHHTLHHVSYLLGLQHIPPPPLGSKPCTAPVLTLGPTLRPWRPPLS